MTRRPAVLPFPLAALGAFAVLAVAWTWPLARHLGSRVAHDAGDPVLNTWILWWNAQALPFTDAWWNPPVFFPMRGAFALSEHLVGLAVVTTPLQWLGASPLAVYNLALILSFALSAWFAYLLVRYLLRAAGASPFAVEAGAVCAGLAFGFAPYRAGQLAHLQVLTTQWMPLALLAMHAWIDGGRRRWLAVAGGAWVLQALSNGYYLLFFPVLAALWLAWFVPWRQQWRRGAALMGAFAAASLLLVPGLLQYLAIHGELGLARRLDEMRMFSAVPGSFLAPPHALAFWPPGNILNQETFLFPGVTALAVVVAALLARRGGIPGDQPSTTLSRRPLEFYVLGTLVLCWLAFGPALPEDGFVDRLRIYSLLTWLPGYDGLRVPARFVMLAYLCLAIAAGLGLARLLPARPAGRIALAAAVCVGLGVDGWTSPMPLVPRPGRVLLPDVAGAAVLELPADDTEVNVAAMYRATRHRLPLVNGYSGHVPPHYRVLRDGIRRGDPTVLTALARGRPLIVSLHTGLVVEDDYLEILDAIPGVEPLGIGTAGRQFLVPAQTAAPEPPPGPPLPATRSAPAFATAELDLGEARSVRAVAFPLRWHYGELNNQLEIQASEDGLAWTTVWMDWTGGPALLATLEDPREAPVRIPLPDVRARYIRVHPLPPALLREVTAHGESLIPNP